MPVDDAYLEFVREILAPWGPIRTKRMFGGAGVYAAERFVAVVIDDALYLKADEHNRPDFEALGLEPFRYHRKDGRTTTMGFYPPPADALDNPDALAPWVEGAIAAAHRAAK